jgi:hypothetical protein
VLATGSALTFDGSLLTSSTGVTSAVGGGGKYTIAYTTANANSRSWRIANDLNVFGDFAIQQSTTQTGSTFRDVYTSLNDGTSYWSVGGSEQMRLTSTGLGIGTSSPSAKLDVNSSAAAVMRLTRNGGTAANTALQYFNGTVSWYAGMSASGLYSIGYNDAALDSGAFRLDTSGNLGLGVTPSAWGTGKAFELGQVIGNALWGLGINSLYLVSNARWDGSNYRYTNNGAANNYGVGTGNGTFTWFTAPSGTAGNAITFTQAMTLDASGNLLVGTTSSRTNAISTGSFLQIESTSSSASPAIVRNSADITGSYVVLGKSRGTSVGSFTAVTSGDQVGGVSFEGADGASLVEAARVQGFADGTVSTGIVPGRLVFSTANTSGSLIERMRITSTGALAINGATSYGTSGQVLTSAGNAPPTWSTPASGTVTSVGFTGGIISVATPTTTPAFTVAGTSGGIPYFSSGTTWASSAALAANALVVGGGAGVAPATTTTGTGVVTALGNAANATGGFATINGTATLTNKRIDPRTSTSASTSSLTPDISSFDQYNLTALAATLAINAPIGTPVDGNKLLFRILDNGTTRTINWNATYTAIGVTLPTATTANKMIYVGCIYNSTNTRWDVVAVTTQA